MPAEQTQTWDPDQYDANARFVSELGMPVVELLAPKPGESILDLGCGDGALTVKLSQLGCTVLGVDASPEMVAAARARNVDAMVLDGHSLPFAQAFDAVFSNAALHWMKDPAGVVAGVWGALKPGGRFVGEFGGYGNVSAIVIALETALLARGIAPPSPWYFPCPKQYRALLETQGFVVEYIELIPRLTPLPGGLGDWIETFAKAYFAAVSEEGREAFIAEVVEALRPKLCDENGRWFADYVRLRFRARKPAAGGDAERVVRR